VSNDVDRFMSL